MMTIPDNKNVTTISYTTAAIPTLISHDDVPGIEKPVSIVKASVFWRERLWNNGHILPEYITVFLLVPTQEYTSNPKRIGMGSHASHPNTNGVYIHIIGNFNHPEDRDKKLILPRHRVIWTSYSKYLRDFGWTYMCSVGKYEGASLEDIRQRAYTAIRRHRGKWYIEDATFKTEIEINFGLLKKAVNYFIEDVFREGVCATDLEIKLKEAINIYDNFLWRNLGDDSWERMIAHLVSIVEVYFKEEYPPKLEEEHLARFISRLKQRFSSVHDEVFNLEHIE